MLPVYYPFIVFFKSSILLYLFFYVQCFVCFLKVSFNSFSLTGLVSFFSQGGGNYKLKHIWQLYFFKVNIFLERQREREIKTNKIKTINKKAGERKKRKKRVYSREISIFRMYYGGCVEVQKKIRFDEKKFKDDDDNFRRRKNSYKKTLFFIFESNQFSI